MSQTIHCRSCEADSVARGVADLIDRHTNEKGRFCCARCGGTDTYLRVPRRHRGNGWIKGIVPFDARTQEAAYAPFVFLTAPAEDGEINGLVFKYYWKTPSNGSGRKRASRPEGGPVMDQGQLLSLVRRLVRINVVSSRDWRELLQVTGSQGD
jgi:hypothetical protein